MRGNRYRPSRLRVRFIPKRDGGQRRISIPTVADRVLQRATLQVLLPRFDRKFLSCSYGYRPKRGVAQAVAAVIRYRDRGLRYRARGRYRRLLRQFGSCNPAATAGAGGADWRVLQLMRWWLDVGRPQAGVARGIALGMPISPLWANLYLHEMDWQLVRNRWPLVRYADDFVVLAESAEAGELARKVVSDTLAGLKLRLEPTKTRVTSFSDGFEYLGVRFQGDSYSFLWEEKRITVQGRLRLVVERADRVRVLRLAAETDFERQDPELALSCRTHQPLTHSACNRSTLILGEADDGDPLCD